MLHCCGNILRSLELKVSKYNSAPCPTAPPSSASSFPVFSVLMTASFKLQTLKFSTFASPTHLPLLVMSDSCPVLPLFCSHCPVVGPHKFSRVLVDRLTPSSCSSAAWPTSSDLIILCSQPLTNQISRVFGHYLSRSGPFWTALVVM